MKVYAERVEFVFVVRGDMVSVEVVTFTAGLKSGKGQALFFKIRYPFNINMDGLYQLSQRGRKFHIYVL